jgi:hypothetical protein
MGLRLSIPLRHKDADALIAFVHGRTKRGRRIQSESRRLIYLDSLGARNVVATRVNGRVSFARTCSPHVIQLQVTLESLLKAVGALGFTEGRASKQTSG